MRIKPVKIAPSILAADFGRLAEEAKRAESAGADWLHVDVMDGHFVPNLTIGPDGVSALRNAVSLPLDVHLMISRPDRYWKAFADAGAGWITCHAEAEHDLGETLSKIREAGIRAGPALNPDKDLESIEPVLPESDLVLVMSVFPGFGGQKFMPEVLEKVRRLDRIRRENGYRFEIEIDGGITLETVREAWKAGVDVAVAGTALYRAVNMEGSIAAMREAAVRE
jgi:ribulose-phosphate 3-epimerase